MSLSLLLLQGGGAPPQGVIQMIVESTWLTRVVLTVLAVLSMMSWWVIFKKAAQFRHVRRQGDRFLSHMEKAQRLEDAYKSILSLPESPYGRVFRQGVNFFSELRPGALRENAAPTPGLSLTQLEALRMILEKVESEERDALAHGIGMLAVIGTVGPLLGLLGTVIGVMDAFLGISIAGSSNIMSVAPGIAEALIATVAGLVVAIPAVFGYNHFVTQLNLVSSELEGFSSEFIGTLAREGRI